MTLPVELFLALRYLRPRRSFVSIITVMSFLGVMIGVAALIVVLSVMAGFQQLLSDKIIGFNAHITVAPSDGGVMYNYDEPLQVIRKLPEVLGAAPFIRGPVLIRFNGKMTPAFIKSVPSEEDDPALPLRQKLVTGDFELRGDSVLVGKEWGRRNGAFPDDKIQIFGPSFLEAAMQPADKANKTYPLPEEPTIRGIFQTGDSNFDLNFLLVSTQMAQHIWGMKDAVHGISVRLKSIEQANAVNQKLNDLLGPDLYAHTWMDDNKELFNAIATERVVMACLLFLILMVAAFGLCSTLITVTVQKSREIGLMKALGANDMQVCGVFLFHGTVVGVVGSACGTGLGLLFLKCLNQVRDFILYAFHVQVFDPRVYGLPQLPAVVNPTQVTIIAISAVVVCVLAALLPAVNAAALAPARALRYE